MKIVAAKKFTRSPPESNLRSSFLGLSANQNCNHLNYYCLIQEVQMMNKNFLKKKLNNREFVLNNIFVGLQRCDANTKPIVKESCEGFDGIEKYLYVRVEQDKEVANCKFKEMFLNNLNISVDDAWKRAQENTNAEAEILGIRKNIRSLTDKEYSEDMKRKDPQMFIVSNKKRSRGASAILNENLLKEFAKEVGTNMFVVIPSSIHEMIIFSCTEEVQLDSFSEMVKVVNENVILPEERLVDKAYLIRV